MRPDGKLVAARVVEVEATATGEFIRTVGDGAACRHDGSEAGVEIVGVQDDQRSPAARLIGATDSTGLAALDARILDPGVLRTVVVEGPAECR